MLSRWVGAAEMFSNDLQIQSVVTLTWQLQAGLTKGVADTWRRMPAICHVGL